MKNFFIYISVLLLTYSAVSQIYPVPRTQVEDGGSTMVELEVHGVQTLNIRGRITRNFAVANFPQGRIEVRDKVTNVILFSFETDFNSFRRGHSFSGSFSINGSTTLQIEFSELTGYNKEVDFTSMMISSDMNMISNKTFNENGEVIGETWSFFDAAGNLVQSQTWNREENEIFASNALYDDYLRPVGQTLSAPISDGQTFGFTNAFATVGGGSLSESHWTAASPPDLDSSSPLGAYYGTGSRVAETGLPYTVSNFYEDGSGEQKSNALPGDYHFLKSGNNALQKALPILEGELPYYTHIRNLILSESKTGQPERILKRVIVDANGNEFISYVDENRNTIAAANSGPETLIISNDFPNFNDRIEFHIPSNGATVSLGSAGRRVAFRDLLSDTPENIIINTTSSSVSLDGGFYSLEIEGGLGGIPEDFSYQVNYSSYSYNFFDSKGRLVASMTPKGVEEVMNMTSVERNALTKKTLPYTTLYNYDFQGRLTSMTEPDVGRTVYKYRKDGQIRFSQNSHQRSLGTKIFSFTNYDDLGRPIESGECQCYVSFLEALPDKNNAFTPPDGTRPPFVVRNSIRTYYDQVAMPSLPPEFSGVYDLEQTFTLGAVAGTESESVQSWYSYDDQGRVTWYLQYLEELDKYFLIQYEYDFLGNVLKVAFQPQTYNVSGVTNEAFFHRYSYDANQRLSTVETSIDDTDWYLHATYSYYKHGPLERVVLADNLQGIDYTYTPQGWLKSINHPIPEFDPGHDDGTVTSPDAFGMSLEYHNGDYKDGGLSFNLLNTDDNQFPDQFNGNIKAAVFGSADQGEYALKPYDARVELDTYEETVVKASKEIVLLPNFDTNGGTFSTEITDELSVELLDEDNVNAYAYSYDEKYQVRQAKFGFAKTHSTAGNDLDVNVTGYDENGNIQGIDRYDEAGQQRDDFDFTYAYELESSDPDYCRCNRLVRVSNYIDRIGYNEIGQITSITYHPSAEKTNISIEYDVTGKVTNVREQGQIASIMQITYDDRGFRLKKRIEDEIEYYIRDASGQVMAIYRSTIDGSVMAQKELPIYGASKLGMAFKNPDHYKYIYELTDHLGNVRALVTKLGLMATATMEYDDNPNGVDEYESQYFDNLGTRHLDVANNHTGSGSYGAWTKPSTPVGPTTTLRVKAGDEVSLEVFAKYTVPGNFDPTVLTSGIINLLTSGVNGGVLGLDGTSLNNGVNTSLINNMDAVTGNDGQPLAYMQYILLDQSFEYVDSYAVPVSGNFDAAENGFERLAHSFTVPLEAGDGYLFAYVVNESTLDVFFDDFSFEILGTRVIRKTDFYPFGAVAKVWNSPDQLQQEKYRHGYQGQYSEKDTTTGWNAFQLRMYDPLIGRWLAPDPARQYASPYVAFGNNPINRIDPDGGTDYKFRQAGGNKVNLDGSCRCSTVDFFGTRFTFDETLGDFKNLDITGVVESLVFNQGISEGTPYTYTVNGEDWPRLVRQLGINANGAAGFGAAVELGVIWDQNGGIGFYFNPELAAGGDYSIGLAYTEHASVHRSFNIDNIVGQGGVNNLGIGFFDIGLGGDKTNPNNNFSYFGETYNSTTIGVSVGSPFGFTRNQNSIPVGGTAVFRIR